MKHSLFRKLSRLTALTLAVAALFSCRDSRPEATLYVAGDSTAQTYNPEKTVQRGWAQMLPLFFEDNIHVENRAIAGRSSKSFRAEGRWDKILEDLKPGDFVLIQFGHNDTSTKPERQALPDAYRHNLIRFVEEVREREATPLLATSIAMCTFDSTGTLVNRRLKQYPQIMREVADSMDVPLLDMHRLTSELIRQLGPVEAKKLYLYVQPGEDPAHPDGRDDDTHLRERGGLEYANIAIQEFKRLRIKPFCRSIRKDVILAQDEFESQASLDSWFLEADTSAGQALLSVREGELHLQAPKGATLWYDRRFQGNLFFEFESCIVEDSCAYDRLSDMNCFWMAVDPQHPFDLKAGTDSRAGVFVNYYRMNMYYLGYGGNRNTTTRFRRYEASEEAVTDVQARPAILTEYTDAAHLLQANRWYSNRIEVCDGRVLYWIDGRLLVDYSDAQPYDEGWFAFRTTQAHSAYRHFRVGFLD